MMDFLNNISPEILAGFIGVVLPPVVDFVKTKLKVTRDWIKVAIAVGLSVIIGGLVSVVEAGGWTSITADPDTFLLSMVAMFTASQLIYDRYWKGSDLNKRIVGMK